MTDLIKKTINYVQDLFQSNSGGHDVDHTLRVYRNAQMIASREPGCDCMVVSLGALLHDADDHKLFATENNANAKTFLKENQVPPEMIDRICEVINAVSFSRNKGKIPETLEGRIVQDADRLDAIGAIGIARTFAYGGEHGRPLDESVQHFYDKLLLLKDLMNTEAGKQMAERRHMFLKQFLKEYQKETQMEGLRIFYLEYCPYCRMAKQAYEELLSENPAYKNIPVEWVEEEEHPEISNQYDYYRVPTIFLSKKKLYEARPGAEYGEIMAALKKALEEVLL